MGGPGCGGSGGGPGRSVQIPPAFVEPGDICYSWTVTVTSIGVVVIESSA